MNSYYLNSLAHSLIGKGRRALKQSRVWESANEPVTPIVKLDTTELVEPEDSDPEEEQLYTVERLVGKCRYWNSSLRKMVVMYKVKWLGYEAEENTWATVEELSDGAKESIEEFEQQRAVARKQQRRVRK